MCLNGLRCSQNTENGILRALNFKFSWVSMPPNLPSLVGANHSCKILDPPLRRWSEHQRRNLLILLPFIMLFHYFFTLYLSLVYTVNYFYIFPVLQKYVI